MTKEEREEYITLDNEEVKDTLADFEEINELAEQLITEVEESRDNVTEAINELISSICNSMEIFDRAKHRKKFKETIDEETQDYTKRLEEFLKLAEELQGIATQDIF